MSVIANLVSYWSLEEASGTRADAHGGHTLSDNNTVTSGTGKVGTAAQFTAANSESLSASDHDDFSINGDFSVLAWVKPSALGASTFRRVATKDDVGSNREWSLYISDGGNVVLEVFDSVSGFIQASSSAITSDGNTWSCLISTYTAADKKARVYVNAGSEAVSAALTNGPGNTTSGFYIGTASDGSFQDMDGLIDEVGIWGKLLTSDERTWLYNSGSGRSYADIVAEAGPVFTVIGRATLDYGPD